MDQALLSHLRQALGESAVHTDPHARELHSADALNPARVYHTPPSSSWKLPAIVVEPRSTEEVLHTVRLARQYHTPIVPFGGGTGVMGGAVSEESGIIVDLKSMNKIRSLSAEDRVVWAEAGIVLRDLEEALNREGLLLGHDPWSVPIATLGGAISTNGVGYRATRYGPMGGQVLGLEVVLPTGDVLNTKAVPKYASGPNLNHLFIGAEGTLGIITAAALRVHRLPEERRFAAVAFDDFETGFRAVSELFALGVRPALTDLTEETSADERKERRILASFISLEPTAYLPPNPVAPHRISSSGIGDGIIVALRHVQSSSTCQKARNGKSPLEPPPYASTTNEILRLRWGSGSPPRAVCKKTARWYARLSIAISGAT